MLLNFRVSNFRSFKDEASISFVATRLDAEVGRAEPIAEDGPPQQVLPVVAVLGANASGKSNLLRAIAFMRTTVLTSASRPVFEQLDRDFFKLDSKCRSEPTLMELDFSLRGVRYQYGFQMFDNAVTGEWLNTFPHKRSQTLFDREQQDFQFGKKLHGQNRMLSEITRPNSLFLSVAAQAQHPVLSDIFSWFLIGLKFLDVPSRTEAADDIASRIRRGMRRQVQMLRMADLGVVDTNVETVAVDPAVKDQVREWASRQIPPDSENREEVIQSYIERFSPDIDQVTLTHRGESGFYSLPFEDESLGTRSWLVFVSYALEMLDSGGVLLVDELDASLHPLLVREAVKMFQDKRSNRRNAQLIFTTHDTTVLSTGDPGLHLSRGQFWFAEKTAEGGSYLTPLSDFRPRKNENLMKGYLDGRYGGTPQIQREHSLGRSDG